MRVALNGELREIPDGTTVEALIESVGLSKGACAAEVNKELIFKRQHSMHVLHEGDAVELVSLVGGG